MGDPNKEFNLEPVNNVGMDVYHEANPDIIWLDFDISMKRIGFSPEQALRLAETLVNHVSDVQAGR